MKLERLALEEKIKMTGSTQIAEESQNLDFFSHVNFLARFSSSAPRLSSAMWVLQVVFIFLPNLKHSSFM
jgi:hypothetical protein